MATTTDFTCNKDARIASSGGTEMGSGTSDGLPYGTYSGYKYRSLLGFSVNMAGWTSITSAYLWVKSSNQIHIGFGSDPTFVAQRIQANWSEGSSSGLSTGNAVIYPGPSTSGTNQVQKDAPTAENTWTSVDITAMMRDVLGGAPFYGIRLIGTDNSSAESGSAANVGEIYSRNSGSGTAYLRITYETNRAPNAPSLSSPDVANGGLVGTTTPTINAYVTDPDANNIAQLHWQIDDNSDFSSPVVDGIVPGPWVNGSTIPLVAPALTRSVTYYVRVQSADASVWGAWSATFSFKVASLPVLTLSEPSGSGRLARLTYDAGSGWGSPRAVINWAMTCPDGGTQATWRLEFYGDAAGAPSGMVEDITVNDTQSSRVVPYNLVEGNYYNVRVTATCSHGLTASVGFYRVRARWGLGIYSGDMGAAAIGSLALTSLDVTDESTGGAGRVVIEYQTTAAVGTPSVWASSIGGAGLNRYFYYRVWLLMWGASPAVSPTLNQLNITYSTSTIVPDNWTLTDVANQAGDVSSFVYGTKSFRMKGKAAIHWAYQLVPVVPNTLYILSARIQSNGAGAGAFVDVTTSAGGGELTYTPEQWVATEFKDPASRVVSTVFNSGNNTALYVRCIMQGPVGTTAWFDAIKLEASSVVTPWSPGYVANAVVLDAGGLQIDATQGGIFRLKAATGNTRDIVELGANGLKFGGDTELLSASPGALETYGHVYGAPNMVVNGSFEQGLGGWTQGGSIMSVATDDKVHGYQSCKFGPGSYSYIAQGVQIVAGRRYVGSFWMKAGAGFNAPSGAGVVIEGAAVAGVGLNYALVVSPPSVWTRYTFQWTAANSGAFALLATNTYGGTSTGTLWIDNISLQEATWPYVDTPNPMRAGPAFSGDLRPGTRFYRTDLNMEFYSDGSRWLSTQLFEYEVWLPSTANNMTVTTNLTTARIWPRPMGNLNIAVVGGQILFTINGGVALSGSNYWKVDNNWAPADGNVLGWAISSGAVSTNRHMYSPAVNPYVPGNDDTFMYVYCTKVGTPGPLYLYGLTFSYRAIAT